MKNLLNKAWHGLAPALGAGAAAGVLAILVGPIGWVAAAKIAAGAFVGYMIKPARPEAK